MLDGPSDGLRERVLRISVVDQLIGGTSGRRPDVWLSRCRSEIRRDARQCGARSGNRLTIGAVSAMPRRCQSLTAAVATTGFVSDAAGSRSAVVN